jgi:hypothetical protein
VAWTTTQLLAHIRRVASLPAAATATGYTDADLLVHADSALSRVSALVANARDEHAIHTVDVAVAANQVSVRLPPRVASGRLRDVTVQLPSATGYVSVPRLEPEDAAQYSLSIPTTPQSLAVVVQAGFLRIVPASTSALNLRLSYVRAPPALAAVSTCTLVTALTAASPNITATHSGTIAAGSYDFTLLSNGDSLGDSVATVVAGAGSTTFAAANMGPMFVNVQAECTRYVTEGLYLCPAGTTCVVPLPNSLSPLLAYRAASAFMVAIGDSEGSAALERMAERMEEQLVPLLSERIEGEPQVVRPTFQNRGRGSWRW